MSAQTILLVEDDPDIRDGARILLAGGGGHDLGGGVGGEEGGVLAGDGEGRGGGLERKTD